MTRAAHNLHNETQQADPSRALYGQLSNGALKELMRQCRTQGRRFETLAARSAYRRYAKLARARVYWARMAEAEAELASRS